MEEEYNREMAGENYALQQAVKAIRKSEFRLRTLFNSAHDAIFTMNNKTFIDCNDATLRIFQCNRDQIVGQTPYRFSPEFQPDGRTSEAAAMEKINAVLAGVPQFFEWRHIRYDGTPFDAEVSLNRLDLEGEIQIQAIVRDVSDRKKSEQENKRLAMVANATTNLVLITDGDGKIQWVNPAFTNTTGYTIDEVLGKRPVDFLLGPESDKAALSFMFEKIKAGEGFKDLEIVNYTKERKPYWVILEVHPIYDQRGNVIQFVSIETDITERKASQQALLNRNEELSKINAELDRFVYSASHDLRAPIASLLGLIEVARKETDQTHLNTLFDMQKKSLLRLDNFIKDIVDHSRNTRLQVSAEVVKFEDIIQSAFDHLQFMEQSRNIKKNVIVELTDPFYSSLTRIEIILNNLISNAIKYADFRKPNPFIEITVKGDENKIVLRVKDNGEGMRTEAVPRIFDMFYRASSNGTGSGLGLYIVQEAVQKIGGTIFVNSVYGEGTEFVVELPKMK